MQQIQVARAERTESAEEIVKKLIGEVEGNVDPRDVWQKHFILENDYFLGIDAYPDIEAFGKFTHSDFALELRGNKLWLFSVYVR